MNSRDAAVMWRPYLLALGVALLWIVGWYHQTALAMVEIWWRSETFTHAFIVPPISLWLIWQKRDALAMQRPRPSPWLLLALGGIAFGWLLGELAAVNSVTQLMLMAMLVISVPALLGIRIARSITFPLAFLFFAVPIGEFVMPQMMQWTADVTVLLLRVTGIPVYQEGQRFVIPSGSWSVIEACSGVRYLIASLVVGVLFAYLNYRSMRRRMIFSAVAIVVPVLANWARAYLIVMLGHLSGNSLAHGVDHIIYGWLFFGAVIMAMFMIGMRWREDLAPEIKAEAAIDPRPPPSPNVLVGVTLAILALTLTPAVLLWSLAHEVTDVPHLDAQALSSLAPWRVEDAPSRSWKPAFENPSAEHQWILTDGEHRVGLYLGYYRNQNYQRKLVNSENVLVISKDPYWSQVNSGSTQIDINGQALQVRRAEVSAVTASVGSAEGRLTVWHWYWINGHLTASDYQAKAYIALSRLMGRGDDSAVVILSASENQPGGGEAALESFVRQGGAAIEATLEQTRAGR